MSILMFNKDQSHQLCKLNQISDNIIEIVLSQTVTDDVLLSGFKTLNEHNYSDQGDYSSYTTIYEQFEDDVMRFKLSNDGTVKPEPEPIPEPEPYIPTLEEIKLMKITEINSMYENTLVLGTNINLTDGTQTVIGITQDFQNSITSAYISATATIGKNLPVPFEINNICGVYTAEDIIYMYIQTQTFLLTNKSLKNDLIGTVGRLTTIEAVENVTYSTESLDEVGLANMQNSLLAGQAIINELKEKYLSSVIELVN